MYVLVLSNDPNCRRFCVDNLLIRGYLAAGLANIEEGRQILQNVLPDLILLCQTTDLPDSNAESLRANPRLASTPIVLVSSQPPDPQWLAKWNVSLGLSYPIDPCRLIEKLEPWLPG